jgi:hypothetical protein
MRSTTSPPTGSRSSRRRPRTFAALGIACAAAFLAPSAGAGASASAATVTPKTTTFAGRIVSGTGSYAKLRGSVKLVLSSSAGLLRPPGPKPSTYGFTLTLSAPSCAGRAHCVSLHGKIIGGALGLSRIPDVGASYTLEGSGRVGPLGQVTATGTSHSLGFIARGRFPLHLQLRRGAGTLTIDAQGPLTKGFSSPF